MRKEDSDAARSGRANHFARAAEQSKSGESDHGRRDESEDGRILAHRPKKDLPAHRAQEISEVDIKHSVNNMAPTQSELKEFAQSKC